MKKVAIYGKGGIGSPDFVFSHEALTSRLHWDQAVDYVGEAGLTLFQEGVFAGGAG